MFGTIPEFNQSLEMFKTMWGQGAAGQAGQFPFTTDASKAAGSLGAAFPGMDIEELEKRIKDLKSVENWLNLNLNILKSTIQGLEVQHATMMALKSFGDAVSAASSAATPKSVKESQVINNTNIVNTNKPMAPKNPLPSVRNTEKSFSEMIFYSTRVV